uniref:Uncharacterized protein n=1 Tax=Tanacetum cinerariifolium TaxID=118510 RepID=A0A699H6T9_TANCI|nr:hypothetical protein [Tanacetum cinerariifolium]
MVAFLKKPQGSKDFYQIVDFLNASHIRTLDNREIKLNATVDGQDKTITEASIRRHLKLADVDGISTLPTTKIFKQLALMGTRIRRISIRIPQSNVPSSVVDEAITKEMHDGLGRATTTASSLKAEWYRVTRYHGGVLVQSMPERLSNLPNKPTLGEALENELKSTKVVYNKAFITLTKRVNNLEKKLKHKRRRVVFDSSKDEEASLYKEDSPKQRRMIEEIDEDEIINLVKSSKQREAHETAGHRMEIDDTKVVDFSTASPQKDDDEITLAETLVNIKNSAEKDKGKAIMQESDPSKKIKKKKMIQISLDEEIAQRLYEEEPAEEELGQEEQKKQKVKEDLSQERLQQMMVIIPEEGIHVEALQTKYPIIDWEIYTEGTR